MARHFLGLYLLIAATLAAVSWTQDQLLQLYAGTSAADDAPMALTVSVVRNRLRELPEAQWKSELAALAAGAEVDMELLPVSDIAGRETLDELARGATSHMQSSAHQAWVLKAVNERLVLAVKSPDPDSRRTPVEWLFTLGFYTAIALVIMIWLWPLTRDLRSLETAARHYGDRNWHFDAVIGPRSPVYPLANTFRKMASRIDSLIASHRDMSNAVSHEIKTPLSRMRFEIELAQADPDLAHVRERFAHLKADVGAIDDLVNATLEYAFLERADVTLNVARHDVTSLIPAMAEAAQSDAGPQRQVVTHIEGNASHVCCDLYLMESAYRNLLYNAMRFARRDVRVTFQVGDLLNRLTVEDDGPGIPLPDRTRVFDSFVQLHRAGEAKQGFGLGLAIVKRVLEWHNGDIVVDESPLGGARFTATWPTNLSVGGDEERQVD